MRMMLAGANVTADSVGVKGAMTWDDATWILTSAFIIFTMQSGFGMLESGAVASKNTVNILVKNVVDVCFGGITYWMFGFALSFGSGPYSNAFCGFGNFFLDTQAEEMGLMYATFVFQLSFATTATTIVSGAMAERTRLTAYIVFSFLNTIVYCIPAHWVWAHNGFLAQLGAVGSGVVHLVGATSGLVATLMLKPRKGRYQAGSEWPPLINPVNAIIGTFMLWWGWLAFNCGSTFGISGGKWMLASKAAFTTLLSSFSGGMTGIIVSYIVKKGKYDVSLLLNATLGSLVSITASCPLVRPYEAIIIGVVGALCTLGWTEVMNKLHIDDPVSAVAVHGASGVWGMVAVGLFVEDDNVEDLTSDRNGLLKGGGFYLLGVQLLAILCEMAWSVLTSFILLWLIQKAIGLRMSAEEELLGADYCEHGFLDPAFKSTHIGSSSDAPDHTAAKFGQQLQPGGGSPVRDLLVKADAGCTRELASADEGLSTSSWSPTFSNYFFGFGNDRRSCDLTEIQVSDGAAEKMQVQQQQQRQPHQKPQQQQPSQSSERLQNPSLRPPSLQLKVQRQRSLPQSGCFKRALFKARFRRKRHASSCPSPGAGSSDSGFSAEGPWSGFGSSFSSPTEADDEDPGPELPMMDRGQRDPARHEAVHHLTEREDSH